MAEYADTTATSTATSTSAPNKPRTVEELKNNTTK